MSNGHVEFLYYINDSIILKRFFLVALKIPEVKYGTIRVLIKSVIFIQSYVYSKC